jgi:hypothetical protein
VPVDDVEHLRVQMAELQAELDIARGAVKRAERDAGAARAELVEVKVQLARARQEHEAAIAGRRRGRRKTS